MHRAQHTPSVTHPGWHWAEQCKVVDGQTSVYCPHTSRFGDTGSRATYQSDLASQNLHLAYETAEDANPESRHVGTSGHWPGL